MGFSFFHKITVLLYSGQALSDACSPCFSTLVMSWSGCHLSIYICTILDGSVFWGCTLKFCLYDIIWEGVLQACSHQVEEALFGIVLHLASARFIWWPKFLYWKRESASFTLSLSPLDNLRCPALPLSPSCSPYPTYFSFNLGWRDPTYSVTACRNYCTYSVILGALLWSFFVSTVPLFFEMQGHNCTQYLRCGWNMNFQCDIMTFLFSVPFLRILNTQTACFDCGQTFMDHTIPYNEEVILIGSSQLCQAVALYVKLGWIFFFPTCVTFLSVIGDHFLCDEKQSSDFIAKQWCGLYVSWEDMVTQSVGLFYENFK